ncbi:hypothetical protein FACUT_4167 [Fusarium acutatum]|uniref:Fungal N-terminal domain-containing protein n=1 Tax=Fusarium acutatum TaxID=78861 RepID=A0A8H4NVA9_9HYPO|nr:hypothetical protein FACUT_4167 [Fusarium acutatum]
MSDALSVVGSAVGIISLGIHVCQGLVSYLQSFKSQDQDIQDSIRETQTIVSLLNSVKGGLLKLGQHSATAVAVVDCLKDSEEKLCELQVFLHKLQKSPEPSQDTIQKIKNARHALIYPFLEGKLLALRQSLQDLLHNLDLAVNIASLYAFSDEIDSPCADGQTSDLTVEMRHQLHGINDTVQSQGLHIAETSDRLLALDNAMGIRLRDTGETISRFETTAQDLRQDIVAQITVAASNLNQMMSRNQHLQEELFQRLGRCLEEQIRENGLAKDLLGSYMGQETLAADNSIVGDLQASTGSRVSRAPTRDLPGCHCKLETKPWKNLIQLWHIKVEYEEHSSGLTIRHQNVVLQKHSPVFDQLSNLHFNFLLRGRDPSGSDILSAFEDTERAILSLYRDGKASPSDRDEYGSTQAEIACGLITLCYNEMLNSNITNTTRAVAVMAAIRLIKVLSSIAGAEGGNIGATNMAVLLRNQEHDWIRFYATTFNLNWHDIIQTALRSKDIRLSSLWSLICDSGQYYETPLLVQAMFQESEDLLQSYLAKYQQGVNQIFHGFTPFQLCIQWTKGIQMLLSSQISTPVDEDALWLSSAVITKYCWANVRDERAFPSSSIDVAA